MLKPGQTVIEATSGNTGVALAAICAARGYPFVAVMTETFSIERRKLIRAYGGKVVLTPAAARGSGMVAKAVELAQQHGWFLASQFENPANPAYHRQTTAAEILRDFAGRRLDYFVTGWGTGGTLTGVGEVLKVARPEVQIIATEPAGAALLSGNEWQPHRIQGWTPDFVPAVLNRKVADHIVLVDDVLARDTARALAATRRHLHRHLLRRHPGRRPESGRGRAPPARCCWRCCRIPANVICRPFCSKVSTRARTRCEVVRFKFDRAAFPGTGSGALSDADE